MVRELDLDDGLGRFDIGQTGGVLGRRRLAELHHCTLSGDLHVIVSRKGSQRAVFGLVGATLGSCSDPDGG
mgnify:CR=1 FL=1